MGKFLLGGPVRFMILCELVVAVALAPAEKRADTQLVKKIITAMAIISAIFVIDYYIIDFNTASTSIEMPICYLGTLIFMLLALKLSFYEAIYCTTWSIIVTEISMQVMMPFAHFMAGQENRIRYYLAYFIIFSCTLILLYKLIKTYLSPYLQDNEQYHVNRSKMRLAVLVSCIYLILSNYQFIFFLLGYEPEAGSNMITIFRFILGCACLAFLLILSDIEKRQKAELELKLIEQLWYCQQEQYKLSQENIDIINRKCHDLKYQMEALRQLGDRTDIENQLKEMQDSIMIYDSIIKTENPVLDTVLTEKSLFCEAHQIQLTCMVDGEMLKFMEPVDLYTLFGNALDNAIESVLKQVDKEKRIIRVSSMHEKDFLVIRFANYCDYEISFIDGLPRSTKKEKVYHGFGLKSIHYTAGKYGGDIICQVNNQYFILQILLPIPKHA